MVRSKRIIKTVACWLLILVIAACPGDKGGGEKDGDRNKFFSCYLVQVTTFGDEPIIKLKPPIMNGPSPFEQAGLSLSSVLGEVAVKLLTVNSTENRFELTFEVTNRGDATLERVWLAVMRFKGDVTVDEQAADGHVGAGMYYFLRNLEPGEKEVVTVVLLYPSIENKFKVLLDVLAVEDRIAFQYMNIDDSRVDIYTIKPDGTDLFRAANIPVGDFVLLPVYSSDGGWVAFSWGLSNNSDIGLARADGGGIEKLTCFDSDSDYTHPWGFTPDGKKIYITYFDEGLGTANIYLLDIATARLDCASKDSITSLTVALELTNEWTPLPAHNGEFLVFLRKYNKYIEPPYLPAESNTTCCENWVFGSEGTYMTYNYYIMPLDPITGLPTGPEVKFWGNALIRELPSLTPDSRGLLLQAVGCPGYRYVCNNQCNWGVRCLSRLTKGLYRLDIPDDWSSLPLNYIDNPEAYTFYPGFFIPVGDPLYPGGYKAGNPSWCWQSDRVVYTDRDHHIGDCDPYNCYDDKGYIYDGPGYKLGAKCTPAVADP